MENLLPTLASIDVTSDRFRETALPYQQWQARRTCQTPTTPSDIGHLLPPIGDPKPRRHNGDNPSPVPPEPPLPRPAPVDCNLESLYDPALDPSPIGKEERGKVQSVQISRIVPRCGSSSGAQDLKGAARQRVNPDVATVVTVFNGYKIQGAIDRSISTDGNRAIVACSDDEDNCIDIFLEGFSRGIDHATLLPSETFCRALQNGGQGMSNTLCVPVGGARYPLDARERYLGLTILLARIGEWFQNAERVPQNDKGGQAEEDATDRRIDGLASEATIARLIFQRADGSPGPSRNAVRVQFEPGPLGVELEEYPGQRGVVQVRRVLQAGQAELDGRLSAGCLIVAVGNWDESREFDTPPPTRDGNPTATSAIAVEGVRVYGGLDIANLGLRAVDGSPGSDKSNQVLIRSLVEIEVAISRRNPDRLFVLWVLDRKAPEAIAALGYPEAVSVPAATRERSSRPIFSGRQNEGSREAEGPFLSGKRGDRPSKSFSTSAMRRSESLHLEAEGGMSGGAPGWGSGSAFLRGKDKFEYSLSSNELGAITTDRNKISPNNQLGETQSVAGQSGSALRSTKVTGNGLSESGTGRGSDWTNRNEETRGYILDKGGVDSTVGWEFETGGGMFDENDQGLAARKQPRETQFTRKPDMELPPPFPFGLQASAVDEFTVFIWFCNNHESSVMKVSWMDYDGKRVPRRSLTPGSCYFERSFATHPWVVEHDDSNDGGDTKVSHDGAAQEQGESGGGVELHPQRQRQPQHQAPQKGTTEHDEECCVVRLGDAMSLGRLTASLIWNPTGRTLSITKQAKVGVPGMRAAAHAAVGSGADDGAGLDPGMKRLCMAGPRREAEEARARAVRSIVRGEKIRTLQEMKTWRTHPHGGIRVGGGSEVDVGGDRGCGVAESGVGALGQGVPNVRVIMVGSSSSDYSE